MSDREPEPPRKLTPRDVLSKRYLQELFYMGIVSDEQIEAHLIEDLKSKGIYEKIFG